MRIAEQIKGYGGGFLLFIGFILIMGLFALVIKGAVWLTAEVVPFLLDAMLFTVVVHLAILLPLSLPRVTRPFVSAVLVPVNVLYCVTFTAKVIVTVALKWGMPGVVIGLMLGGIGIIPAGFVAAVFSGDWVALTVLTGLAVITYLSFMHSDLLDR